MNLYSAFDPATPVIVLAEGELGTTGGKTANGVVMHSELFDAQAVIDSSCAASDAGSVLDRDDVSDVPVVDSMADALETAPDAAALVIGVAPAGGALPEAWVEDIQQAMRAGCDVVSGLHVFLSEDEEWQDLADECGVELFDVRKPPAESDLRVADGRSLDVEATVVLTMGTDCAVGKRTTTFELYQAARAAGLDAGWVATGQTGIMIGADRGVVIDRVPADFTAGVVEDLVCAIAADHEFVFVEGQAALTHHAYSGVTLSILQGSAPDAVVLVDDPTRERRTHFERLSVAGVEAERRAIEALSDAPVAAVSTWAEGGEAADLYDLPAANVYEADGPSQLLAAVRDSL
ncbi:DUF1611 domain-containing protein [Haloarchaeobius sp. HME9146]|uniref:DUF1611 domain-containing protein n=1 Tax=Haloarchaeobius sp. HME9146 TaxID=2978732 RepID=UPI0021C2024E|nr:DUF1611 domain-containing protein [Haloarchaeobius sp. HME9146]MCT9097178.1 DUF1611 domain-containing protein [Haloarchaeobius sp. HME9146]